MQRKKNRSRQEKVRKVSVCWDMMLTHRSSSSIAGNEDRSITLSTTKPVGYCLYLTLITWRSSLRDVEEL